VNKFSSNIIANEYSWGTIRQLLVKPIKRWKIYLVKYISTIVASVLLFITLLAVSGMVGLVFFAKNSSTIYDAVLTNGVIVKRNMLEFTLLKVLSDIFSIIVISSFTFLIAALVRSTGLATVLSLVVYFGGYIGGGLLSKLPVYKYILTTNLSLHNYLPGEELPFEGAAFIFSFVVCLIYLSVFLITGSLIFSKRDVY